MSIITELQQQREAVLAGQWVQGDPGQVMSNWIQDDVGDGLIPPVFTACLMMRACLDEGDRLAIASEDSLSEPAQRYVYAALFTHGYLHKVKEGETLPHFITQCNDSFFESAGEALEVLDTAIAYAKEYSDA